MQVDYPEKQYWEQRYFSGGTSGPSTTMGKHRTWKLIDQFVQDPNLLDVLDVGCGDLSFWDGRDCDDYIGIDFSKTVIDKNTKRRPRWHFIHANAENLIPGLTREIVLCMSVLFHIMDEGRFRSILHNLCHYSRNYIFIYTWKNNPFSRGNRMRRFLDKIMRLRIRSALFVLYDLMQNKVKVTDNKYEYFRSLDPYLHVFREHGFSLLGIEENPDQIGALYVFKKTPIRDVC